MVFRTSDNGPAIGMNLISQRAEQQKGISVGLIEVALSKFLHHHLSLHFQTFVVDIQGKHPIGFQPKRRFQIPCRQGHVVIGDIVGGESIAFSAGKLQRFIKRRSMLRASKHQMFKKMRKPGMIGMLVSGAHAIKQVEGSQGGRRIPVHNHPEPIM